MEDNTDNIIMLYSNSRVWPFLAPVKQSMRMASQRWLNVILTTSLICVLLTAESSVPESS